MRAPEELGRVYRATLPINSNYAEFVAGACASKRIELERKRPRNAHASYRHGTNRIPMPGALQYGEVIALAVAESSRGRDRHQRRRQFRRAGCTGISSYKGWRTQLAPTSGSMGYGVPAGGGGEDRRARSARWSRSPATATSS